MERMYNVLSIVVVLLVLLAACGPAPTPETPTEKAPAEEATENLEGKVTIWYSQGATWSEPIQEMKDALKKLHPGIEMEFVTNDPEQLSSKLVAAFAAGSPPDVCFGQEARILTVEQELEGWADLSGYIDSDPEFAAMVAALPESQMRSYWKGDKLWALPEVVQTIGIFVRKSWLEEIGGEVPTDWEEMTDIAVKFTKPDKYGYCIFGVPGVNNSAGTQFVYTGAAAGMEYPVMDPDGNLTFNTERGVEVLKWLYRWHHVDKVTPPSLAAFGVKEFYAAVKAGQCGMGRVGAWNIGAWKDSEIGEDFIIIPYPPMEKGQAEPNYQVAWNNGLAMSKDPTPEAYAVFKFLLSKEVQEIFFPYRTSWARADLDFDTLMGDNELLLYYSEPQPHYAPEQMVTQPCWLSTLDILSKHINAMYTDPDLDPEKVLQDAYDEATAKCEEIGE